MVICLFYSDISAQVYVTPADRAEEPEELLAPCGNAANFAINQYNNTPSCCAQFTDPNGWQYSNVSWDFGDGTTSSADPSSIYHCYNQQNTYQVKRSVTLDDGTICTSTKSVSITNCTPCPQILDIDVVNTNTWNPSSIPERTCSSSGFVGDDNGNLPELNRCIYRFTPILNTNLSGFSFNWETSTEDENGIPYFNCTKAGVPDFYVINSKGPASYYIRVKVTVTSPNCGGTVTKAKRILLGQPMSCTYTVVPFRPTGDDTNNESLALTKKVSTNNNIQIYPNPVDDILHVSNLKDSENYTFDIHNTLGQTILSQKVSSIDASVNVMDLETGIYIGVVKSQGKIIATQKIYKK